MYLPWIYSPSILWSVVYQQQHFNKWDFEFFFSLGVFAVGMEKNLKYMRTLGEIFVLIHICDMHAMIWWLGYSSKYHREIMDVIFGANRHITHITTSWLLVSNIYMNILDPKLITKHGFIIQCGPPQWCECWFINPMNTIVICVL